MMEMLGRSGFTVEVVTSTSLEIHKGVELADWIAERGIAFQHADTSSYSVDVRGLRPNIPPHARLNVGDVPITLYRSASARSRETAGVEHAEFLALYEAALDRFRPDVVVNYGGDRLADAMRLMARERGIVVVFMLHNFNYHHIDTFMTADAVIVPSRFAADHYRSSIGLDCAVLPYLIDFDRVRVTAPEPRYVTFVNPSYEKGVYVFARIADELGRRRPDIPLLVVEGRGSERTLADCGIDLRMHGNVHLMANTRDPREFWSVTCLCLMPSLWRESQGLVAVEAMLNGIPVIAGDRGALPETLGGAGILLPLPERLTSSTRELPAPSEVASWVETIIRIWDEPEEHERLSRLGLNESARWKASMLVPSYVNFFQEVRARRCFLEFVPDQSEAVPRLKTRREFGIFLNHLNLLGTGAEIGIQRGHFARQVLDLWRGEILYLIDAWRQLVGYQDVANVPNNEHVDNLLDAVARVRGHWQRVRIIQELSENAARMIPDGTLDWVYLDADHQYSAVIKDLTAWVPKVREGGVIAGHDHLDGVLSIQGVETRFGVRSAVRDFFGDRHVDSTLEDFPTWYHIKSD